MSIKTVNIKKGKVEVRPEQKPGSTKIFNKAKIALYEETAKKRGGQYGNGMFPPKGGK